MSIEAWLLFVATETVLCLSPGPAVLLILSVSLTRGWHPGLQASAGILVANLLYFFLSATSVGAILLASWELFWFSRNCRGRPRRVGMSGMTEKLVPMQVERQPLEEPADVNDPVAAPLEHLHTVIASLTNPTGLPALEGGCHL